MHTHRLTILALLGAVAFTGCDDTTSHAADNTGVNERDRDGKLPLPTDQGGGPADLEITQTIRAVISGEDSLSIAAENVKIVTEGGLVTLRGPVETVNEKERIEAIARGVAGVVSVRNELEVVD